MDADSARPPDRRRGRGRGRRRMTTDAPHRHELARHLRTVRIEAGHSGASLARELGWTQPRVSRLETGSQLPTEDDLSAWITHTGVEDDRAEQLRRMLALAESEYASWKVEYSTRGAAGVQRSIGGRETETTHTRQLAIGVLPGLVQTPAFARAVVSIQHGPRAWGADDAALDEMVAARMQRQHVLYEPDRTFTFVIPESTLRTRFSSDVDVQIGQLDRLATVAGLATVNLYVMPDDRPWPVFPLASFVVHDHDRAVLEEQCGEHIV